MAIIYKVVITGAGDKTEEEKNAFLQKLAASYKKTPSEILAIIESRNEVLYEFSDQHAAVKARAFLLNLGANAEIVIEDDSDVQQLIKRGEEFTREGKYNEALKSYSRAMALYPRNLAVTYGMINVCILVRDEKKLFGAASLHAQELLRLNKMDRAYELYLKIIKLYPVFSFRTGEQLAMAEWLATKGEWLAAAEAFRQLAVSFPDDSQAPKALSRCANLLYRKCNQPENAIEIFKFIIDRYADTPYMGMAQSAINHISKGMAATAPLPKVKTGDERMIISYEKLKEAAEAYSTIILTKIGLRKAAILSIIFGVLNSLLSIVSIENNSTNRIGVLIGVGMLAEGIWLFRSLKLIGVIVDGIVLIILGGWNIFVIYTSWRYSEFYSVSFFGILALSQLVWGIRSVLIYSRLRRAILLVKGNPNVSLVEKYIANIILGNPDIDRDSIMFSTTTGGRLKWKAWLGPHYGVFTALDGAIVNIFTRDLITIEPQSGPYGSNSKVSIIMDSEKREGNIESKHLSRFSAWKLTGSSSANNGFQGEIQVSIDRVGPSNKRDASDWYYIVESVLFFVMSIFMFDKLSILIKDVVKSKSYEIQGVAYFYSICIGYIVSTSIITYIESRSLKYLFTYKHIHYYIAYIAVHAALYLLFNINIYISFSLAVMPLVILYLIKLRMP